MITPSSFMSRVVQESEYDILGELTRATDAQGLVTNRTRTKTASGWSETESGPGIYSRTTLYYLDGRVRSITGTLVAEYYDYEYTSQGLLATTVRYAAADSSRWKRRYTDGAGRLVREEEPGFGDLTGSALMTTDHLYNGLGQLVKTRRSGKLQFGTAALGDQLFEYDQFGRQVRQGISRGHRFWFKASRKSAATRITVISTIMESLLDVLISSVSFANYWN